MGIPKLFRQLSQNYSHILTKTNPNRSKIEWLGIDFNSMMHPVCATIAATQEKVDWKQRRNWPKLFQAILQQLKKTLRSVSTTGSVKEIYIAIDGVVPMAKIIQQRSRRFRSSYERRNQRTNWDSCLISPGTYFMNSFESYFKSHLKEINKVVGYEDTKCILSSTREFGEGEHKIMKRLRKLDQYTNVAIYGLDADLIILGMTQTKRYNVCLFRENVHCAVREFSQEEYVLMNINNLWEAILKEIQTFIHIHSEKMRQQGTEPTSLNIEKDMILQDFILLSCYFGNDFVPAIPMCSLSIEDSIWFLLESYAITLAEEGTYMVQSVTDSIFHWNTTFLLKFWNICARVESSRMKQKTLSWIRFRSRMEKEENNPIQIFHSFPRKKQDWMRHSLSSPDTYLNVFTNSFVDYTLPSTQRRMVLEWMRGSMWVLHYYLGLKVDPFWWYVWTPPPTIHMMNHYFGEINSHTTKVDMISSFLSFQRRKKLSKPTIPFQLMCIIPPDSEYSVPTKKMGWKRPSHPRQLFTIRSIDTMKQNIIWAHWPHQIQPILPMIELPLLVHSFFL